MKWGIVAKGGIDHVRKAALGLRDHLVGRGEDVWLETDLAEAASEEGHTLQEMDAVVDLFMTVGGDGTILMTQHVTDKPVFAVNAGAIGFMAEVDPPDAKEALDKVIAGKYRVEERDKLSAYLGDMHLGDATNEVTIQASLIAKLIKIRIDVDGEELDTMRGDGLIVSTPTGSTGYAMSVGGPLVHPAVRGTVLAPIAPFRLSARPWVIPEACCVEVTVVERESIDSEKPAKVVVDGQHATPIGPGETVTIRASKRKARFVRLGSGFYERVRTKLTR